MAIDRKAMTSSALRRRRQVIKAERAKLKKELREIEAEMLSRSHPGLKQAIRRLAPGPVEAARGRW